MIKRKAFFTAIFLFGFAVSVSYSHLGPFGSMAFIVAFLIGLRSLKIIDDVHVSVISALIVLSSISGGVYLHNLDEVDGRFGGSGVTVRMYGYFYRENPFDDTKVLFKLKRAPGDLDEANSGMGESVMLTSYKGESTGKFKSGECGFLTAKVALPKESSNYGFFDYRKYLSLKRVFVVADASGAVFEKAGDIDSLTAIREGMIVAAAKRLSYFNNERSFGVSVGMLLGFDDFIKEEELNDYYMSGTVHILTVSGFHFALMYGLFAFVIGRFEPPYHLRLIMVVGFISVLLLITGFKFAPYRAGSCMLVMVISPLLNRRFDFISAASVLAIFEVVSNPYVAYDMSFVLTFLACVAIGCFCEIAKKTMGLKRMDERIAKVAECVVMTVMIQLALFIPIIQATNTVNLLAVASSLMASAIAGVFMALEIFLMVVGLKGEFVNRLSAYICEKMTYLISLSNSAYRLSESAVVTVPDLDARAAAVFSFFAVMAVVIQNSDVLRRRSAAAKLALMAAAFCLALSLSFGLNDDPGELDIYFFDSGQGDSVLVRTRSGKCVLIDAGPKSFKLEEAVLNLGISKLDGLFLTHAHADHVGGLDSITTKLEAGNPIYMDFGDEMAFDGVTVRCVYYKYSKDADDENLNCRVYLVSSGEFDMLVTGDIGFGVEREIVSSGALDGRSIEILKVAHHGSKYSSDGDFLDAVKAVCSVISVGRNTYGHPTKEAIRRLEESGSAVFRTDKSGVIKAAVSGGGFVIVPFKD